MSIDSMTLVATRIEKQDPQSVTFPIGDSVLKGRYQLTANVPVNLVATHVWVFLVHDGNHIELAKEVHDADNQVIGAELQFPRALQAGETVSESFCVIQVDIAKGIASLGLDDAAAALEAGRISLLVRMAGVPEGGAALPHVDVPVKIEGTYAAEGEKTYEMMWDCRYCGSTKLLGKTHRHCPTCGAPQDASARYFPPDDERVAVEDHQFVGVDWQCHACDTPNAASSDFCTNCGAGKDGSKPVHLAHEREAEKKETPPPAPASGDGGGNMVLKLIIGAVVLFFLFLLVNTLWRTEGEVKVTGHAWERSIEVEEYKTLAKDDWKNQVPKGGYDLSCKLKERATKKVADGEECKNVKVDNGDGTFKEKKSCSPKYKEVPVNDQFCTYKIDSWSVKKVWKKDGKDLKAAWPAVEVKTCATKALGCEREGAKGERYDVLLQDGDGESHTCSMAEAQWKSMQVGTSMKATFSLTGLDCSSLTP